MERYTSPSRLEAEKRVLFRGLFPLIVGRASRLAEPDSFFTHDATGVPLLVTCDRWGTPHAFVNLCRHRGARLVFEERGRSERFVCRYHGWSYDTCGRMTTVSLAKCDPTSRSEEESSLAAMRCAILHGFVWLGRGSRREPWEIAEDLGDADAQLGALSLEEREVAGESVETVPVNWKLVVEEHLTRGGVFLFPSSFVLVGKDLIEHVAIFPETVETTRVLRTGLSGERLDVAGANAPGPRDRAADFHARIDVAIAERPRRF